MSFLADVKLNEEARNKKIGITCRVRVLHTKKRHANFTIIDVNSMEFC